MLFTLMDSRKQIGVPDLEAAYEWVHYWRHSLIYIFDGERAKVEAAERAEFAETVYQAIASINGGQGCTQTEINRWFGSHISADQLSAALEKLSSTTPPRIQIEIKKGKGRPTKIYYPA